MTTNRTPEPEGPRSRSMQRKIALQKGEPMPTYVPTTPAPSQPAGVREFYRDVYKRTPTSHEGYLQFAEAYARQQTAAKDAELADANQRVDFQRTQILDLDAAVERQTALKKSAERERDSLREDNAKLLSANAEFAGALAVAQRELAALKAGKDQS